MPVTTPPCTHPAVPISVVGAPWAFGVRTQRPYATFKISVDAQGKVTDATLEDSTGVSAIDDASAQAVRKWTFKPATTDCKAVASAVEYTVPIGEDAHTFADPCNHDTMVAVQAQPEYPDAARNLRLGERAVSVRINVDGAGRVVYAGIIESSENMALDQAALMAARQSTYYPTVHACTPVSGSYTFTVTYDPGS